MSWRNDPITKKQKALIDNMYDFSEYPLPVFTGRTKGEASDFIDKYISLSHETIRDCWDTTQGIP